MRMDCLMEECILGSCKTSSSKSIHFDACKYSLSFIDYFTFRGMRASRIFFDATDDRWTLESLKSPGRRSKLPTKESEFDYPIGRQTWTVEVWFSCYTHRECYSFLFFEILIGVANNRKFLSISE